MKLKPAHAGHFKSGPNMIPLVDVVMVLLIFLMLSGRFGDPEHFLISTTPIAARLAPGQVPPPGFVPHEPLEIRVDSPTPDRYIARADGVTASELGQLTAQLAAMRQRLTAAGKPTDQVQVIISPTRTARYSHLLDVYQAALAAGFTRIGFSQSR